MKLFRTAPLFLALTAAACLENEESLTIRPDGSVTQQIRVKGNTDDLADGYPITLRGIWRPGEENTREWLEKVGAETGGAETLRRIEEELVLGEDLGAERTLLATRDFPSVEDLPSSFADPSDPYYASYLQRSASLRVEKLEGRTIYIFERTYHARPYGPELFARVKETRDKEDNWEEDGELSDEEAQALFGFIREMHTRLGERFLRNTIFQHYTLGSAALSAQEVDGMIERLNQDVSSIFATNRLRAFMATEDRDDAAIWLGLMQEFRDVIRIDLADALVTAQIPSEERNAIQFALESEFTAYDHTSDLGDESFRCNVTLPGRIVAGNFDELLDGSTARWEFDGERIWVGDVTLRAVSVLE